MSNWNGKLLCVKDYKLYGSTLTKGKVYDVKNGIFQYDDGYSSGKYSSYEDFIKCNSNQSMKDYLIETLQQNFIKEPNWHIEQSKLAKYIMINETVTIAIPIDTPMGVSFKHPDDEYDEEISQALALKRMLESYNK